MNFYTTHYYFYYSVFSPLYVYIGLAYNTPYILLAQFVADAEIKCSDLFASNSL